MLVIPLVVVLLLVVGFVTFLVLNAIKKGGAVADDEGTPGVGPDESPLGDTTEHSDARRTEGKTAARRNADDPDAAAHVARPGEGEGREQLDFDGPQSAAERS